MTTMTTENNHSKLPLVTIATATTANPFLSECVESVKRQSYPNIQHLLFVDGQHHVDSVNKHLQDCEPSLSKDNVLEKIILPYSVGKDRWNGHRMYGAATYLAEGQYIMFLDDDNSLNRTHVEDCLKAIEGKQWAFSLRYIHDKDGKFICEDNCESLGIYPSILNPNDYFVDLNCYFLRRDVALAISPVWYRKAREPGVPEIDRVMCHVLRENFKEYACTNRYTVNYTAGNTEISVQKEFFLNGNEQMLKKYGGKLPWKEYQR